ncbi:VanZ like protein [Gillisia sp. Hel_I_86]|uniref:VanZ family protein n=1 Tax=Gillisia sp. Hel_I_86 TaxID=1249981 RepID=UPI00119B1490|nr:VanZ family protein [Gillisia sp. Hel_I_86]TVZ26993.1 VanZ like protein [Gillisia sp. Hel_I_86]
MAARILLAVAVLYTILIASLSLVQLGKISIGSFSPTDKMMHLGAYFVLGFVWFFYYLFKKRDGSIRIKGFANITGLIILFGMLIEVLQGALTDYRDPDWADILANSIGVLLALGICLGFLKSFKRLKHKINSFL